MAPSAIAQNMRIGRASACEMSESNDKIVGIAEKRENVEPINSTDSTRLDIDQGQPVGTDGSYRFWKYSSGYSANFV
jgi:hypothetical protein